jgi:hypothetical protein
LTIGPRALLRENVVIFTDMVEISREKYVFLRQAKDG